MGRTKFTAEEKREMVLEYFAVARGQRGRWLAQRDVSPRTFYVWRQQIVVGALETGLIPRGGVFVTAEENREMARLHAENKRLRAELDKAKKDAEIQARAVDALGKAIELLQDGTAPKSVEQAPGRP